MKITPRDIAAFLKQPDRQTQAALLYGPDSGLVRERSREIAATILGKNPDPLNRIELNGNQIKSDPALLLDELNALSLMGGNRVVIVRDPIEKIEPIIKSAFERKNSTYLIIEAEELPTSSALRKLFEKEDYFAAIACYLEEGRGLEELIRTTLTGFGLNVNRDALMYLTDNLGNDRMVTRSELEKLALYMGNEKEVTLPIAMQLTGNNASESIDDLCNSIALGKSEDSGKLLAHLLNEGTQPVAIVRSLIRYFQRLDIAHGHIASGQSREQAIKMLRPPVFFKSVPIIERALSRLSPARISQSLTLLLRTEKEIKSGVIPPALLISNAVLTLQKS
ncbi:MAG TPA: DNA polymerase III subunit delta [Rickettsiales bacterium]|nr:DNA polymerase III subunit delta [Rickettsiales bacterium]